MLFYTIHLHTVDHKVKTEFFVLLRVLSNSTAIIKKEELPPNAPPAHGNEVEINAFVDADHAGDKLTRRSHTGILIFLNSAPIIWYSKRQATIETSTFGSEVVALRTCLELTKELRYKLRMLGVPLAGPAVVWGDNKSVVNGASIPTNKLNKKHLGICYHAVREASAAGIWTVAFTKGMQQADTGTKVIQLGKNTRSTSVTKGISIVFEKI